jgi:glycerol uptake facilitator protein
MKARRWADWWRERCTPWNHDVCGGLRAMALSSPTAAAGGPSLLARALAEGFGCMLFHFVGSASPTPVANGVILMVIVYHLAKVSGAHLNPAVTLTFSLLGHTTPVEMLTYWAAQTAGCIVGAMWIAALVPGLFMRPDVSSDQNYDGCFRPRADLTSVQVFGWEAVGTFCFLVPIFSVVWYTQNKSGYGNTGPLIVGLSLMGTAMAVGPWTGAALNPARALGSPTIFACGHRSSETLAYYILGELAGAAAVPIAIMPWYGIAANPWYRRHPASPSRTSSASDTWHTGPVVGGSTGGGGQGSTAGDGGQGSTAGDGGQGSTAGGGGRGSTATEDTPQILQLSSLQRYLMMPASTSDPAKDVAKTEQTYMWAKTVASTGACDSSGNTNIASNRMSELGYSHRNRPRNSIERVRLPPPSTPRSGAECHTPRTAVTSPASSVPLPVLENVFVPSDKRAFGSSMQYTATPRESLDRSSASLPRVGSPPVVGSHLFKVGSPV